MQPDHPALGLLLSIANLLDISRCRLQTSAQAVRDLSRERLSHRIPRIPRLKVRGASRASPRQRKSRSITSGLFPCVPLKAMPLAAIEYTDMVPSVRLDEPISPRLYVN